MEKAGNDRVNPGTPGRQEEIWKVGITDTGRTEFPGNSQECQMPQALKGDSESGIRTLGVEGQSKFNGVFGGCHTHLYLAIQTCSSRDSPLPGEQGPRAF